MMPGIPEVHPFPGTPIGIWLDDFKIMKVENGYVVTLYKEEEITMDGADDFLHGIASAAINAQQDVIDPVMAKIHAESEEQQGPALNLPKLPKRKVTKELRYVYLTIEEVAKALTEFFAPVLVCHTYRVKCQYWKPNNISEFGGICISPTDSSKCPPRENFK